MSKTKHTPGPWKVDESGSMIETEYQVNLRGEYDHICGFRKNLVGDFDKATARLIASAPDLLEALQRIHRTSVKETFHGNVEQFQEWLDAFTEEAIAKAKGAA